MAGAPPLRLTLASNDGEREAVYRFRYHHVIAAGWASPSDLPGGLEHDRFDDRATHVMAWDGDELVGACRLVLPDEEHPLPAEAPFDLVIEPRGQAPTIDRLLIDASHRGSGLTVVILARAWLEMRKHGFELISGVASERAIERFRRMGLEVTVLAGPRVHWGEPRYAILAVPSAALVAGSVGGGS